MIKKNSFNVNDISTWPVFVTMAICSLIFLFIVYLVNNFFVLDVKAQISNKDYIIKKEENKYRKNKQIAAMLPIIRKEVERLEKARDNAKEYLPTNVSMPSLIDDVYETARNNGIVFTGFMPDRDIDKEFYTIKPISLTADVGYESMSYFIEDVTKLKRIMNIDSVSFKANGDDYYKHKNANAHLSMTAQLRTYIFKEDSSK